LIAAPTLRERLARRPPGYRLSLGRVLAIYAGLMVTVILSALDQTIVATALPRMVGDLGGLSQYPWVFTSYLLAATVTIPLYGKLGDVFGRRRMLLTAISIFLLGSILCGLAQTMNQLVVCRAAQGLGAGGLVPLTMATIGAIVPLRDRGRYQGLIGAAFACGAVMGPLAGGFIVDHFSWRYIFFVNAPIGLLAMLVIVPTIPRRLEKRVYSIDWLGALVLAAASTALLVALVRAGQQRGVLPWLAAAVALTAVLVRVELRAAEPILPFRLFRQRSVVASVVGIALAGIVTFGAIVYVPLFVQGIIGTSATASGVVLTPLMLGMAFASIVSGQWIAWSGRIRPNAVTGPVVLTLGAVLLWRLSADATNAQAAVAMVVTGLGSGLIMQVFILSVQNAVPRSDIGSATALTQFARSIGSTVGVTLIGVVVNHGLPARMHLSGTSELGVARLAGRSREAVASALSTGFFAVACVGAALFVVSVVGIEEISLRRSVDEDTELHVLPTADY
jgi:EmrB/QacA subfamily drug resistance transporter